jgi:hypothetical protein
MVALEVALLSTTIVSIQLRSIGRDRKKMKPSDEATSFCLTRCCFLSYDVSIQQLLELNHLPHEFI